MQQEEADRLAAINKEREQDERMLIAAELGLSNARLQASREQLTSEEQARGGEAQQQTTSELQSTIDQAVDQLNSSVDTSKGVALNRQQVQVNQLYSKL